MAERSDSVNSATAKPKITISNATTSDAPAIAAVGAKTYTETFGHSVPAEDLADYLATSYSAEIVAEEIADPSKVVFVARMASLENNVVGFAQFVRGKTDPSVQGDAADLAAMQKLYVDACAQGQGVGSKLSDAIEARAKEEGCKILWLTVWEENFKAQKMYQTRGYAKVGETEYATGTCIQTDLVFSKRL